MSSSNQSDAVDNAIARAPSDGADNAGHPLISVTAPPTALNSEQEVGGSSAKAQTTTNKAEPTSPTPSASNVAVPLITVKAAQHASPTSSPLLSVGNGVGSSLLRASLTVSPQRGLSPQSTFLNRKPSQSPRKAFMASGSSVGYGGSAVGIDQFASMQGASPPNQREGQAMGTEPHHGSEEPQGGGRKQGEADNLPNPADTTAACTPIPETASSPSALAATQDSAEEPEKSENGGVAMEKSQPARSTADFINALHRAAMRPDLKTNDDSLNNNEPSQKATSETVDVPVQKESDGSQEEPNASHATEITADEFRGEPQRKEEIEAKAKGKEIHCPDDKPHHHDADEEVSASPTRVDQTVVGAGLGSGQAEGTEAAEDESHLTDVSRFIEEASPIRAMGGACEEDVASSVSSLDTKGESAVEREAVINVSAADQRGAVDQKEIDNTLITDEPTAQRAENESSSPPIGGVSEVLVVNINTVVDPSQTAELHHASIAFETPSAENSFCPDGPDYTILSEANNENSRGASHTKVRLSPELPRVFVGVATGISGIRGEGNANSDNNNNNSIRDSVPSFREDVASPAPTSYTPALAPPSPTNRGHLDYSAGNNEGNLIDNQHEPSPQDRYLGLKAEVERMGLGDIPEVDPSVGFSTQISEHAPSPRANEEEETRAVTTPEIFISAPQHASSNVSLSSAPLVGGETRARGATTAPADTSSTPSQPSHSAAPTQRPRVASHSPRRQQTTGSVEIKGSVSPPRDRNNAPNSTTQLTSSPTPANGSTRGRTMTAGDKIHTQSSFTPAGGGGGAGGTSASRRHSNASAVMLKDNKDGAEEDSTCVTGGLKGVEGDAQGGKPITRARSRTFSLGISANIAATVSRLAASLPSRKVTKSGGGGAAEQGSITPIGGSRYLTPPAGEGGSVMSPFNGSCASLASAGGPPRRTVNRQPSGSFRMIGGRPQNLPAANRARDEAERRREAERLRQEEEERRLEEERLAAEAAAAAIAAEEKRKQDEILASLTAEVELNERQIRAIQALLELREATTRCKAEIAPMMVTVERHTKEERRQQELITATSDYRQQLGEKRALTQHLKATIDVMEKKLPEWRSSLEAMLTAMADEVDVLSRMTEVLAAREAQGFAPSQAFSAIREAVEIDQDRFSVLAGLLAKVKAMKEEERHRDRELYALDELIEAATLSADKSIKRRERIAKAADFCDYTRLLHESSSEDEADESPTVEEMNEKLMEARKTARARSVMVRAGVDFKELVNDEEEEGEASGGTHQKTGSRGGHRDGDDEDGAEDRTIPTHQHRFDDPKRNLKQKRAADRQVKKLHLQRMKAEHALEMRRLLQVRREMVTKVKDQQVTNRRQGALGLSELFERAHEAVKLQGGGGGSSHPLRASSSFTSPSGAQSFADAEVSPAFLSSSDMSPQVGESSNAAALGGEGERPQALNHYQRVVERNLAQKIEMLAATSEKAIAQIEALRKENDESHMTVQMNYVLLSEARGLHGRAMDERDTQLNKLRQAKRDARAQHEALVRGLKVQRQRASNSLKGQLLAGPAMRIVNGEPFVGKDLWESGAALVGAEGAANLDVSEAVSPQSREDEGPNVPEFSNAIVVRDLFDIIDIKLGLKDPREATLSSANRRSDFSVGRAASRKSAPYPNTSSVISPSGVVIQPPFVVTKHLDAELIKSMRNPSDVAVDDPFYATPAVLDVIYNRGPHSPHREADATEGTFPHGDSSRTKRGTTAIVRADAGANAKQSGSGSVFERLAGKKTAAVASRENFTLEERRAYLSARETFVATQPRPAPVVVSSKRTTTPIATRR